MIKIVIFSLKIALNCEFFVQKVNISLPWRCENLEKWPNHGPTTASTSGCARIAGLFEAKVQKTGRHWNEKNCVDIGNCMLNILKFFKILKIIIFIFLHRSNPKKLAKIRCGPNLMRRRLHRMMYSSFWKQNSRHPGEFYKKIF